MVLVDVSEYLENQTFVEKKLAIPQWADKLGRTMHLDFSEILTDAILKKKCKDCFARFYCSGGCPANSYNFHGTIDDSYDLSCDMERKRVECAIMIKAALADTEGEEE